LLLLLSTDATELCNVCGSGLLRLSAQASQESAEALTRLLHRLTGCGSLLSDLPVLTRQLTGDIHTLLASRAASASRLLTKCTELLTETRASLESLLRLLT
jgi:ABC-type transporter Mla subunit MlaD